MFFKIELQKNCKYSILHRSNYISYIWLFSLCVKGEMKRLLIELLTDWSVLPWPGITNDHIIVRDASSQGEHIVISTRDPLLAVISNTVFSDIQDFKMLLS